jgi:hypothetical protein
MPWAVTVHLIPKARVKTQYLGKCCSGTDVLDGGPLRDGSTPTAIQRIRHVIGEKVRRGWNQDRDISRPYRDKSRNAQGDFNQPELCRDA